MRFFYLREHLRGSLWFIPTLCVVFVVVLAEVLTRIDRSHPDAISLFEGGAESARGMLSTISSSMITFTGLVFTITIVVLQLASQQFSPRVLRTFLRDRHSQVALGVFVATFTYALILLREVRSGDGAGDEFVPNLSIAAALILVILSLALFVDYIHHISQSIRVGTITSSIGDETREAIAGADLPQHDERVRERCDEDAERQLTVSIAQKGAQHAGAELLAGELQDHDRDGEHQPGEGDHRRGDGRKHPARALGPPFEHGDHVGVVLIDSRQDLGKQDHEDHAQRGDEPQAAAQVLT